MTRFLHFLGRLRAVFRRRDVDRDMAEEMRSHLQMKSESAIEDGASPAEARAIARRAFGHPDAIAESCRDERGLPWIEDFVRDLGYAARILRKSPGFTLVAVLTLSMGIGLNTAIFTLLDQFVLQPPRVGEPASVVSVFSIDKRSPAAEQFTSRSTTPYVDFKFLREHNTVFEGLAAANLKRVTLGVGPEALADAEESVIFAQFVSGNYFNVLRGRAELGRTFLPDEDRLGVPPVVVLSHQFWERHFRGDAGIVGKAIVLNGVACPIVGVAAPEFGGNRFIEPAVWVPFEVLPQLEPGTNLNARSANWVDVLGRLKEGITLAEAGAAMEVVVRQNLASQPDSVLAGVRVAPLTTGNERQMGVWILIVALVGILLLIIAANVANLTLARSVSRYREIGVRLTLGAGRGRLIRQLLTESALLGLLGGIVGLALAGAATRLLLLYVRQEAGQSPLVDLLPNLGLVPSLPVFGVSLLVSLIAGLAVGMAPALQATKRDLASALKDEGSLFGHRISRSLLRSLLVIVQVAFSAVLLVGAGLLLRGLEKAQSLDPGFSPGNVLLANVDLRARRYGPARSDQFYREFAERARALPGVRSVGFAAYVPLQGAPAGPAAASDAEKARYVGHNFISAGFFPSLGVPMVAGRNFRDEESRLTTRFAIVNQALAQLLWPGENPVGKLLHGLFDEGAEVVGVVGNISNTELWNTGQPFMYFLINQPGSRENLTIFIRAEVEPRTLVPVVRETIRSMDSELWPGIRPLENDLNLNLAPSRVGASLSTLLGLLALTISSIGLYGVIAYATTQRTREIGVRIALGARPADIFALVIGQGWRLVAVGVALGLAGGLGLGRLLAQFLFGLSPSDPIAFAGVTLFLAAVALLASYLPARRAIRIDPSTALRCEG